MMLNLFAQAQAPQPPVPGGWTDPNSWEGLVKTIGVPVATALIFGAALFFIIYQIAKWMVGDRGWLKDICTKFVGDMTSEMKGISTSVAAIQTSEQAQTSICQQVHAAGGTSCVSDIRTSIHGLADMSKTIASDLCSPAAAAEVSQTASAVHTALRANGG